MNYDLMESAGYPIEPRFPESCFPAQPTERFRL